MSFPRFSGMISLAFLITPDELKSLLDLLGGYLVRIDKVTETPLVTKEELLESYKVYFHKLLDNEVVERAFLRDHLQVALTTSLDSIIFLPVQIAKAAGPLIMLRPHVEGGLEALYPRIYQEAETGDIHNTFPPGRFENTELFQNLQRFLRHHTLPQKDSPLRLSPHLKR